MKNLTMLRLAGFGFFGVTFLSPGSTEKKNWLIDELKSTQLFADLPFTSSAFCQETNYPKKSEDQTLTIALPSAAPSAAAVATPIINSLREEIPEKDTCLPDKRRLTTAHKKLPVVNDGANTSLQPVEPASRDNDSETDTTPILIYTAADKSAANNLSFTDKQTSPFIPDEEETILPPTEYVDEVKIFKTSKQPRSVVPIISTSPENGLDFYPDELMATRINSLADYAEDLNYSGKYAFLINLGLKSGKKRFYIIDLEHRTVYASGLVAHGRGKEKFTLDKKYSNNSGSSCSSLGLYKVGASYYGSFGKSFRLQGLQKTNNNAQNRAIVLHSMGCIPDEEIDYPICQSEGCPSVSPSFLEQITTIITASNKPILLWVFDPATDKDFSP